MDDFVDNIRWIYHTEKTITQKGLKESSTKLLSKGHLIISARGTVGKLAQLTKEMAFNQTSYGLNGKDLIENDFLFYLLKYKMHELKLYVHGSIFDTITRETFKHIIVKFPSNSEQKSIAKILNDLDSKIALNHKKNKILEYHIQRIFNSWFIDFDGQTKFVNSELGKIPKNWKITQLKHFITIEKGLSYKGKFLSESGIPMVNLGNISIDGNFKLNNIKYYTGEFKNKHKVRPMDLVIANTDVTQNRLVLGSAAFVPPLNSNDILFTHHIFALRNDSNLDNYFIYGLLHTKRYRSHVIGYATGTTVLAIPKDAILDFKFVLPPLNLIAKFEKLSSTIFNSITNNNYEIANITKMRDLLLPQLISGKIHPKSN